MLRARPSIAARATTSIDLDFTHDLTLHIEYWMVEAGNLF